jgi:hypothetical protein
MAKLTLFEDFIQLLEQNNQYSHAGRVPMDSNSMFVVDDAKQRKKMAAAFYRTVRAEIAEYEERAAHLIQSGNQSPAIMERCVLRVRGLEQKKPTMRRSSSGSFTTWTTSLHPCATCPMNCRSERGACAFKRRRHDHDAQPRR